MSITKSAWKIMNENNYKSVVNDKKTLWNMLSIAMKKAWSNFKKAAVVLVLNAGRPLKIIERARLQYCYGVCPDLVSVDYENGYLIFKLKRDAASLLDAACSTIQDFSKYFSDGYYWFDECELEGVSEILDELRELPINIKN